MGKVELLLIALGLSADAFAVAVTNGLCNKDMKPKWTLFIALTFGVYQGAMPCLGYALGQTFAKHITAYDHYIALVLLGIIGGKMVYEALKEMGNDCCQLKEISFGTLMVQGVATSIDALAVGVSFSAMDVKIVSASTFIALVTFVCSFVGVIIGKRFGSIFNKKAQLVGGILLILIGLKIFIEHMFF
ncbi:MAG: manganese efflux pump [Clostridiales bacterium]|nr:manganese efflux pump [Clostridiales bacterium]